MINRYRRAARSASELGLGPLVPLDVAIPELSTKSLGGHQVADGPGMTPKIVSRDGIEPPTRGFSKRSGPSGNQAEAIEVLGHEAEEERAEPPKGPSDPLWGPSQSAPDPVDEALGDAIQRAARAEAWSTVEVLTNELRARREARAKVVSLSAERRRRGR